MVNKRSTTGTSANLVTETPAEVEAETASVTTSELVGDSGEPYTDHPNFDQLFLDETVKSSSSVIPFDKLVDKILLFDLKRSSLWTSRGTPAKQTLQDSRTAPSQQGPNSYTLLHEATYFLIRQIKSVNVFDSPV